jgi:transcription-repair coupling factor (superfamily II helicase)
MLELKLPPNIFNLLAFYRDDEFNRFLQEKLAEYRRYFEWNDKESLLKTKEELEKKLNRMREEIEELEQFCETAERDQQLMIQWIDRLEKENLILQKEMRENGDFVKVEH